MAESSVETKSMTADRARMIRDAAVSAGETEADIDAAEIAQQIKKDVFSGKKDIDNCIEERARLGYTDLDECLSDFDHRDAVRFEVASQMRDYYENAGFITNVYTVNGSDKIWVQLKW